MPYTNLDARRARARERYAQRPEVRSKAIANARRQDGKRHESHEHLERWRQYKRNARRAKAAREGRTLGLPAHLRWEEMLARARNGKPEKTTDERYDQLIARNAKDAWRYWVDIKASDEWVRLYFEASGKPWNNPRLKLSSTDKYSMRYRMDVAFAQRERERISERRFTNPAYAAVWEKQGARWTMATRSDDGTITPELLKQLRAQRYCSYCHRLTPSRDRHIDHVWPLAKGGAHSADNLVMACGKCNRAKSAKLPLQWLVTITHQEDRATTIVDGCKEGSRVRAGASPKSPQRLRVLPEKSLFTGCSTHRQGEFFGPPGLVTSR